MNYLISYSTDVGMKKRTNQDSLCIKEAKTEKGKIMMVMVCDGMGGLEKGELASKRIVDIFASWFEKELPIHLSQSTYFDDIQYRWGRMIREENQLIAEYGRKNSIKLGSTLTCILIFEDGQYLIGHVGDSRIYRLTQSSCQLLTEDQTLVALEVKRGRMQEQDIEKDPRRNVLLQCIGASKIVEPVFLTGQVRKDEAYMLCSDGFRHKVSQQEIHDTLRPNLYEEENEMKRKLDNLVALNKDRKEKDNISVVLIKII